MRTFLRSQIGMVVLSWLLFLIFTYLGGSFFSKNLKVFYILYLWIPGFIGLYFAKKEGIALTFFKPRNRGWFLVWTLPITLFAFTVVFGLPFIEVRSISGLKMLLPNFLKGMPAFQMLGVFMLMWFGMGIVLSSTVYLIGYIGQEMMFRGYAWEKIKHIGFWKASWMIGFFWGLWEAPLILLGVEHSSAQLGGMLWRIFFCMLLSPIMIYLRVSSRSIVCSAIFYGMLLYVYDIFPYFFKSANRLYFGGHGLTGFMALLLANVFLFLKTTRTPLIEYEL